MRVNGEDCSIYNFEFTIGEVLHSSTHKHTKTSSADRAVRQMTYFEVKTHLNPSHIAKAGASSQFTCAPLDFAWIELVIINRLGRRRGGCGRSQRALSTKLYSIIRLSHISNHNIL